MFIAFYIVCVLFLIIILKKYITGGRMGVVNKQKYILDNVVYNFEVNVNFLHNIKKKISQTLCNIETDCTNDKSKCANGLCFASDENVPIITVPNSSATITPKTSLNCDEKKGIVPILTVTELSKRPVWVCKSLYPLFWTDNGEKVAGICENGILNTDVFTHQPDFNDCTCAADSIRIVKFNNIPICIKKNLIQLYNA